jgi:hypothetical protein
VLGAGWGGVGVAYEVAVWAADLNESLGDEGFDAVADDGSGDAELAGEGLF